MYSNKEVTFYFTMNISSVLKEVTTHKLQGATNKVDKFFKYFKVTASAMLYIRVFALLYFLVNILYVGYWLFSAIYYKIDLPELRQYIISLSSAGVVAIIGFLSQSLVDRNNDGIPDNLEDDTKNNKMINNKDSNITITTNYNDPDKFHK